MSVYTQFYMELELTYYIIKDNENYLGEVDIIQVRHIRLESPHMRSDN